MSSGQNKANDFLTSSNQATEDWASIVYRGIESDELDYKAAQNWNGLSRIGKAKFVRHCMALANTKGGYIVVGVGEDAAGKPSHYTGMTDGQLKSFDPTDFGTFVNSYVDPPIELEIERPMVDARSFVIIVVRRFRNLPHVCSHNCEQELQQGAIYIRTVDAASRVAYRASEIHAVIQRALRNQRELLGRMLRGILYESGQYPEPLAESRFTEQLRHAQAFLNKDYAKPLRNGPRFDLACYLPEYKDARFSLQDIRHSILDSIYSFHGEPLIAIGDPNETYFTNVSLRCLVPENGMYWQAFQSGLFHCCRMLPVVNHVLMYEDLAVMVAEAVFFLGQYYTKIEEGDELLTLSIWLQGVDGLRLQTKDYHDSVCRIDEIRLRIKRTGADLASGVIEHAVRLMRELCVRFNLPEGRHVQLESLIREHLDSRI